MPRSMCSLCIYFYSETEMHTESSAFRDANMYRDIWIHKESQTLTVADTPRHEKAHRMNHPLLEMQMSTGTLKDPWNYPLTAQGPRQTDIEK